MSNSSLFLIAMLFDVDGVGGRAAGPAGAARPVAVDRRPHHRHAEDRRLLPALLGRAHRIDVPRDPALRHRVPVLDRPRRPASARTTSASTAAQGGGGRIVQFQRVGPRVLLVQPNQSFRSSSTNPLERKSVEDSFAKSVLWGFAVAAEIGRPRARRCHRLLPARHASAPASALRPGNYRVDRTRSAFYLPNTKDFPKNTEVDVTLTFVERARAAAAAAAAARRRARRRSAPPAAAGGGGGCGGGLFSGTVGSVTPTPDAVTLREHVVVRRAARRQLQAAHRRPARRLRRPELRRLQRADRRADA